MTIAFLGIGVMGRPMVQRLIDAGHRLSLFNRTIEKILDFRQQGVLVTDSVEDAIQPAECVIVMLSDYPAIESVLLNGQGMEFDGRTVIQMATILPEQSCELKARIEKKGGRYLECPVLGSRDKAAEGDLILMVGSTADQFVEWTPVLQAFGSSIRHVGSVGQAAALKLALNQLIVALAAAFSMSVGMVLSEGVRIEDFMAIVRESALYAPTFDKKLPRILKNDFGDPNFPVRHMLKDMRLIVEQAKHYGLDTSILQAIETLFQRADQSGFSNEDYSAISRIIYPR